MENQTQPITLSFDPGKLTLSDPKGASVSLAEFETREPLAFWSDLPWKEESRVSGVDLKDLPARLDAVSLGLCLAQIWKLCSEDAVVTVLLPHPRHDTFLKDPGYIKALLPETFLQLDRRSPSAGLASRWGVNFEVIDTSFLLDPHWQEALDKGEITLEDLLIVSKQACNVIEWFKVEMRARKSAWVQGSPPPLTLEMKKQLQEQLLAHEARGNQEAAGVIRQFLKASENTEGRQ